MSQESSPCSRCGEPGTHLSPSACIDALIERRGMLEARVEELEQSGRVEDSAWAHEFVATAGAAPAPSDVRRFVSWLEHAASEEDAVRLMRTATHHTARRLIVRHLRAEEVGPDVREAAVGTGTWSALAERGLISVDDLAQTRLFYHDEVREFRRFGETAKAERWARNMTVLGEAGLLDEKQPGFLLKLAVDWKRLTENHRVTYRHRAAQLEIVRGMAAWPTLSRDDLWDLFRTVEDVVRYNEDPKTRGEFISSGHVLEALFRHPSADEVFVDRLLAIEDLPVPVLESLVRHSDAASREDVWQRTVGVCGADVLRILLASAPSPQAFRAGWERLATLEPRFALDAYPRGADSAALTPEDLKQFLSNDRREVRAKALLLISEAGSPEGPGVDEVTRGRS